MLASKNAMATIAVRDIPVARKFYEQTLGLTPSTTEGPGIILYRSGATNVVVYQSQFAGTNRATSATWGVGAEFDAIVRSLKEAGVKFERYELPQARHDGDVHVIGSFKAAWFRDPDGNILHINNR
jgi:catechol 2,3-dioxygenase-like lactoylglutathione lyase family enzyme